VRDATYRMCWSPSAARPRLARRGHHRGVGRRIGHRARQGLAPRTEPALRRDPDHLFGLGAHHPYGITTSGNKITGRDPRVRPDAVIYDVELTLDMPKKLTVTSLMNSLAHPISTLGTGSLAGEAREQAFGAVVTLYAAMEMLLHAPENARARAGALEGSGLAAQAIESGTLGLHHKLAHLLGGRFDLDHGGLHSVLLPHSVHRLREEAPELLGELGRRLHVRDLEGDLFDFLVRARAAVSLKDLGLSFDDFRGFLETAPELPRGLLGAAFHGRRPSADTRFEDWGLPEPVSVRGPLLQSARRVVVAVHDRGGTADGILARAVELVGDDPTVCVIAPQAQNHAWPKAARTQVSAVLRGTVDKSKADRVVLFGFAEGAGLALDLVMQRPEPLAALVGLSGAATEIPTRCRRARLSRRCPSFWAQATATRA